MYRVYCDDKLIYDTRLPDLKLVSPKLDLELNKAGSLSFTIYPRHPKFEVLQKLKSIVTVYRNNELLFRGRILNDEKGFYNEKQVTCEGELAFLNDSIMRPYDFTGTPKELFTKYITEHNNQVDATHQFKVGECTVTDPNDYIVRANSEYVSVWDELNNKLIDMLGGYLWVRHEDDGIYIDYLEDFNRLNPQSIELGKNLLDIKTITKGEDIFTVLIPLGGRLQKETPEIPEVPVTESEGEEPEEPIESQSEKRLTIESVNDGKDYIENTEAVAKYGRIVKVVTWDDVTIPENLLRKGQETLANGFSFNVSIEVSAVDLSGTDTTISSFRIGSYNKVFTKAHDIDETLLVKKLSLTLDNPKSDKLTLGATFDSFLDQNKGEYDGILNDVTDKVEEGKTDVILNFEKELSTVIQTTIDGILSQVSENYYLKDDTDTLIESLRTSFEQTKNEFNFIFEGFKQDLEDVTSGTDSRFEEWRKYIRFVNGEIELGIENNPLTLTISNDRISFKQSGLEVAYLSNSKLTVLDGEFLNSLQIGKFAFIPRKNGNLSFKKAR